MTDKNKLIRGAGGGSKKSHTPVESPNTLTSKTNAKVLFLLSAGETGGLADFNFPLKSVYFNNVPVQNPDGSLNFAQTYISERVGLPVQDIIQGFDTVTASYNVSTKVTTTTPVVYTSSNSNVDAIRATIRFPALFQAESNGDTNGTEVSFAFYRRVGAGAWSLVETKTKRDKTNSPADVDYLISRPPNSTGIWALKVERITPDNTTNTKANDIFFQVATEIRYDDETIDLSYPNYAVVGLSATSETAGSRFPVVAYDYLGIKVKVPSNYNVTTRAYTGTWDGTFNPVRQVCDNPAWVLYYLLTDETNGLGISESAINKYSFYDAAVYNDQLVPRLVNGAISGTEPRYTFNYQYIDSRDDAYTVCQNLAATFGAGIYSQGNYLNLVQDRPTSVSRIITNSNVIDGVFERNYSNKDTRTTACIVYWNNPEENWLAVPAYYEDAAAVARYGYNSKEITGIGVTSEGQAMRLAKWHVETGISNTEAINFKVGFKNAGIAPGEVIQIMDTDYAQVSNEAKIVSVTSSTIVLDRPVNVTNGNTFTAVGLDGATLYTRTISATSSGNTVTYSGASLVGVVGVACDVVFYTAISPKSYKVTNVREERNESEMQWVVSAVEYDANKFSRVDNTPSGISIPVYQAPQQDITPGAVQNLTFKEGAVNDNNNITRKLLLSWSRPTIGVVAEYFIRWRLGSAAWEEIRQPVMSYEISPANIGTYEVEVYAVGQNSVMGPKATGTYTIDIAGTDPSTLDAPTTLVDHVSGTGTAFTGTDLYVRWTNPTSNGSKEATLRDFEVTFKDPDTLAVLGVDYITAVPAGDTQYTRYNYTRNLADGGPRRSIRVEVRCRDTNNNLSSAVSATFSNAAPAAPTGVSVNAGLGSVFAKWNKPADTDYAGTLVWVGTAPGFTPSASNLFFDGDASMFTRTDLLNSTIYYVRLAHYDTFGKNTSGTGLNLSSEFSATTKAVGIPNGATNPVTGTEGDLFFNTTDGKLYRYHAGAWTATVPTVDLVGQVTSAQIQDAAINTAKFASGITPVEIVATLPVSGNFSGRTVYLTTNGKIYRYSGSSFTVAVDGGDIVAGSITSGKIAAGAISATEIAAGAITGDRIAAGTITATNILAGTITATQIATDTITADKIAANAITSNELAANSVIAGKIAASTITSSEIASNTITAGNILSGTITADKIASNTITANNIVSTTFSSDNVLTRGLTVRDNSGNVILSAGTPLSSSNITPASGWLNSNISVSGGTINGIGTGNGTAVANSAITITSGVINGIGTGSGTAVDNNLLTSSISAAANTAVWSGISGDRPKQYRVTAIGYLASIPTGVAANGITDMDSGSLISSPGGGMVTVAVFSRSTGALTASTSYNTLAGDSAAMASYLNGLSSNNIVVIYTNDEFSSNRFSGGLDTAMYRCGASRGIYGSSTMPYRPAYLLIGIPGMGEGTGYEKLAKTTPTWVEAIFTIQRGQLIVSGDGSQPVIDANNVSTYITSAAIDLARINTATIGTLSALNTFTGTLQVDSTGHIRSGQTAYNTGTGFWLGNVSGTPKFSIGSSTGNNLTWDGTQLSIVTQSTAVTITGIVASPFTQYGDQVTGGGATAYAEFEVNRNGTLSAGNWYNGGGSTIGDSYWVRVRRESTASAIPNGDSLDTWLQINSNRTWYYSVTNAIRSGSFIIEISSNSSGTAIVSVFGAYLNAESYSGAIP